MLNTLQVGVFEGDPEYELREALRSTAIARIEKVRQMWAVLKVEDQRSFACYWAEGTVRDKFPRDCFSKCPTHIWQGIAPSRPLSEPILSLKDTGSTVLLKIDELIEDAVTSRRRNA